MKTLTKASILLGSMISASAMASQAPAVFDSSIASYCTVGAASPGVMHVQGTTITTDSPAIMQVQNNEGGVYKVTASDAGDFYVKPNAYTGTATMTTSVEVTGANTGNIASGAEYTLTNSGVDTLNVSVAGSMSAPAVAGNYQALSTVSCVAL